MSFDAPATSWLDAAAGMGARWDSGGLAVRVADGPGGYFATPPPTPTYLANSPLVGQITFRHTTNVMITTRQYDWLNRLRQTISSPTGPNQPPWVHGYDLNATDQRTRMTLGDGSYWVYEYDSLGQVKSGKRYCSDGTPVAGQQFEYGFDDIGNRNSTKDQLGAGLRAASYTNNTLNQITGRGVPGAVDVIGVATPDDETESLYYGYRYYAPAIGRWLTRDPVEERGGENYHGFCDNDPVGTFDPFGLWRSRVGYTEHRQLTKASFDAAITPFPIVTTACKERMLTILQDANDRQDTGPQLEQLERHYNRPYLRKETPTEATVNRRTWHRRYTALVRQELEQYFVNLARGRCRLALESLGTLTHFWQDYYSHAIHQTTRFSTAGITSSPDSGGGPYWPSSYAGFAAPGTEHPASITASEPFPFNGPVWVARWNASIQFVQNKYFNYLWSWVATCTCSCENL